MRHLSAQKLEDRRLLASDFLPWHPDSPLDEGQVLIIKGDGFVVADNQPAGIPLSLLDGSGSMLTTHDDSNSVPGLAEFNNDGVAARGFNWNYEPVDGIFKEWQTLELHSENPTQMTLGHHAELCKSKSHLTLPRRALPKQAEPIRVIDYHAVPQRTTACWSAHLRCRP